MGGASEQNGTAESSSPSVPAPVRQSSIAIELPKSLAHKMTLSDFKFIKVLGKGSFGKVTGLNGCLCVDQLLRQGCDTCVCLCK